MYITSANWRLLHCLYIYTDHLYKVLRIDNQTHNQLKPNRSFPRTKHLDLANHKMSEAPIYKYG